MPRWGEGRRLRDGERRKKRRGVGGNGRRRKKRRRSRGTHTRRWVRIASPGM